MDRETAVKVNDLILASAKGIRESIELVRDQLADEAFHQYCLQIGRILAALQLDLLRPYIHAEFADLAPQPPSAPADQAAVDRLMTRFTAAAERARTTRHFEGRDVPPYAEPVSERELIFDSVYFTVGFLDEEMLIPVVETLVYIGSEEWDNGTVHHHFQDAESYRAGVRRDSDDASDGMFYAQPEGQLKHIFDYEKALDRLLECSMRRAEAPTIPPL